MTAPEKDRAQWLNGPQAECEVIADAPPRPWRLILLGAPGIGKGTQAEKICEQLGACHLSTGDVFRQALQSACDVSPAMKDALHYMKRGDLVPDETVIDMVRERAGCLSCRFGFLLDGFPRTVSQAEALDREMASIGQQIDAVLSYELPVDQVIERLSGRRTCRDCKTTYHLKAMPPRKPGICDDCGGELYRRDDDAPEAIAVRLKAYEDSTAPLTAYYERRGLLRRIEAEGSPDEVFARTRATLQGEP